MQLKSMVSVVRPYTVLECLPVSGAIHRSFVHVSNTCWIAALPGRA